MARVEIVENGVWIRLTWGEKLMALHKDLFLPVTSLRGAQVADEKWLNTVGFRVPGTAIPGLVIYGTYLRPKQRDFIAWSRPKQVLQLNLSGKPYNRVILGVDDAAAQAAQLNEALTAC